MTETTAAPVINFGAIAAAAQEGKNLTVDAAGGFEVLEAGICLLRLVGYYEFGFEKANNPAHKPGINCRLDFEVHTKKHRYEDADGKSLPRKISVNAKVGSTSTSNYRKLFASMRNSIKGSQTHFMEMLGLAFKAEIVHNKSTKDGKETTYANLDRDRAWTFASLDKHDDEGEIIGKIAVPEATVAPKCFLWEFEQLQDEHIVSMWDSIFVDGMYEADGDKPAKSKNIMQERIMKSMKFEGSRLQALTQQFVELDELTGEPEDQAPEAANLQEFATTATNTAPKADKAPVATPDVPEIPEL